jgi:alpha/beta superfamily hydrolase
MIDLLLTFLCGFSFGAVFGALLMIYKIRKDTQ